MLLLCALWHKAQLNSINLLHETLWCCNSYPLSMPEPFSILAWVCWYRGCTQYPLRPVWLAYRSVVSVWGWTVGCCWLLHENQWRLCQGTRLLPSLNSLCRGLCLCCRVVEGFEPEKKNEKPQVFISISPMSLDCSLNLYLARRESLLFGFLAII